jgi:hypothetical protein
VDFDDASSRAREELIELAEEITVTIETDITNPPERAIVQDVLDFVEGAANHRGLLGRNANDSFEAGLALLGDAARRDFMLRNVLEAMKRGEDPRNTVRHYQHLGLLSVKPPVPEVSSDDAADVRQFQSGAARAALWAGKQLKRAMAVVSALTLEAAKAIPKLATLKMGVTFVGGIPCPSFQLEAGSVDWNVEELWDRMSSAFKNAPI